jgi:hypothetical protein
MAKYARILRHQGFLPEYFSAAHDAFLLGAMQHP